MDNMNKIIKFLKNPWFLFSLILTLGIFLRVLEINKTSFWYDEAFTGVTIKLSWKEMFNVIALDRVHPPVFYILTRLWASVFGFTQDSLRAFSVTWGVGSIFTAYVLGKNIFDRKRFPITGIVLAFVIAISPFFIAYSIEARSYSFLALLALLLGYFVIKWLDEKRKRDLIISILIAALLCSTHYLQIVYVIAILCCIFIYKYVFTEKGVNKKWLTILIGFIALVIIVLAFVPIKEFINSYGITGKDWIPDTTWSTLIKVYYSYSFGVVRYVPGVPPVRDIMFGISPMVIAYSLFAIHTFGFIHILSSKKNILETKRHITFFYILGILTFVGFYILSIIGFNTFIERYIIAGGIILLVSFWSIIVLIAWKWFLVVPISLYVALNLLLLPMPGSIDYRVVANDLENINGVQRYIFVNPYDFVTSEFYMENENIYYLGNKEKYLDWALLNDNNGIMEENIKQGDVIVVRNAEVERFLERGYFFTSKIGNDFYILKK